MLKNAGTISFGSGASGAFLNGGKYNHDYTTGGTVPTATWDVNSTLEFTTPNNGGSQILGLGQAFGNVVWNCTNQGTANINFQGSLTAVNGNLTVMSTGSSGSLRLSGNTGYILSIAKDLG